MLKRSHPPILGRDRCLHAGAQMMGHHLHRLCLHEWNLYGSGQSFMMMSQLSYFETFESLLRFKIPDRLLSLRGGKKGVSATILLCAPCSGHCPFHPTTAPQHSLPCIGSERLCDPCAQGCVASLGQRVPRPKFSTVLFTFTLGLCSDSGPHLKQ